jgi:hypothetical protein
MRISIMISAVIALSACGAPRVQEGCTLEATNALTWSDAAAPDLITASAEGERCADAAVQLAVTNAAGEALWSVETTYHAMRTGGDPLEDAPDVAREDVQAFLASWADATSLRTSALAPWREGAEAPGDGRLHTTPMDRTAYEVMRASDAPAMCVAVSVARSECFVFDAASGEAVLVLATGA